MQALEQHDRKCMNTNLCLSVIIKGGWNYYSQLLWFLIKEQKRAVVVRWTDRVYSSHRFFVHSQLTLFWCSASAVENVKEVLKLSVEQKGAVLPAGELTVYLDGLTVADQEDPAPLTNGNAANGTSELGLFNLNWCLAEVRLGITDKPGFLFFFSSLCMLYNSVCDHFRSPTEWRYHPWKWGFVICFLEGCQQVRNHFGYFSVAVVSNILHVHVVLLFSWPIVAYCNLHWLAPTHLKEGSVSSPRVFLPPSSKGVLARYKRSHSKCCSLQ